MKLTEQRAFQSGLSAEELMESAGLQIANTIRQFFPEPGTCVLFVGRGHNGGDALVAARHLAAAGWFVQRRHIFRRDELSPLTRKKLQEAEPFLQRAVHMEDVVRCDLHGKEKTRRSCPQKGGRPPVVLLDGLLGVGATGLLREPIRRFAWEINKLRRELNAYTVAVDLPTGLDGETGEADPDCVVADFTFTIGYAKAGLVADEASFFVGRLVLLPLPELDASLPSREVAATLATPQSLAPLLRRRPFESHKTEYGRVGIVAGAKGLTGAALLAAEGALRGGAGLVTLFVSADIYPIVAGAAAARAPEIMVHPVENYREILEWTNLDLLAVGPGLGLSHREELVDLIRESPLPMVVDADGLNAIAPDLAVLENCRGPRLLTPHPGEMARLVSTRGLSREAIVRRFVQEHPVTLLLKGARSVIGEKDLPLSYNTTGNPGMATAGMGDVLTGVLAALIAQKISPYQAARIGAWVCGRAAEIALFHGGESEQSLAARDVLKHLGPAFRDLADHLR